MERRGISKLRPLETSTVVLKWLVIQKLLSTLWFWIIYLIYIGKDNRRSFRNCLVAFPWLTSSYRKFIFCYRPSILIMNILLKNPTQIIFLLFCMLCEYTQEYCIIIRLIGSLNSQASLIMWEFCMELKEFGMRKSLWYIMWFIKWYRI